MTRPQATSMMLAQFQIGLVLFMESLTVRCSRFPRNGLSVLNQVAVTCSCQGCDTGSSGYPLIWKAGVSGVCVTGRSNRGKRKCPQIGVFELNETIKARTQTGS
jgi:hypothetical protein